MTSLLPLQRPTISGLWARTSRLPFGNRIFSKILGRMAPYTGTIDATVLELADGYARVELRDRKAVRNHLSSVHAVALMNLGEVATGLAVLHGVDGRGRGIVTELRMEYLKKARGTITAVCRQDLPLAPGKHDLRVSADLLDGSGEVVARAHATWKVDLHS